MAHLWVAIGPHLIDLERCTHAQRLRGNKAQIYRVHFVDRPPLDLTGVESQTMRLIIIACDALTRQRLRSRAERYRRRNPPPPGDGNGSNPPSNA